MVKASKPLLIPRGKQVSFRKLKVNSHRYTLLVKVRHLRFSNPFYEYSAPKFKYRNWLTEHRYIFNFEGYYITTDCKGAYPDTYEHYIRFRSMRSVYKNSINLYKEPLYIAFQPKKLI